MCPAWGKKGKRCKEKNHFAKKYKNVPVHNIESDEELEEISVVRVQALRAGELCMRECWLGSNRCIYFKLIVVQVQIFYL